MSRILQYETAQGRRYMVKFRTPGHKDTTKRGFKTKRDADLYLATLEVAKSRGEYIDAASAKISLGELGATWLNSRTHLKASSISTEISSWDTHVNPRWGATRISDIRHSDVQTWVSELSAVRSPAIVKRAYGIVAAILDVAVKDRRLSNNPARGVKMPRSIRREHLYLSHEQLGALADASGEHKALIMTLGYCGLRWGEATGLRVRDVDLARKRISVNQNAVEVRGLIHLETPKTHERRTLVFSWFLKAQLEKQLEGKKPNDLVFGDAQGNYMKRTRASAGSRSWFKTALAVAGLERMTLHDLRHTAASLAVSSGANVKVVQKMLGHASAAMTLDVYADLFDNDLEAVADALDEAHSRSFGVKVGSKNETAINENPQNPKKQRVVGGIAFAETERFE